MHLASSPSPAATGTGSPALPRPTVGFARLTGGSAAEELGSFSYRGLPDGSIEPDASCPDPMHFELGTLTSRPRPAPGG